jgi:hypothetical protein
LLAAEGKPAEAVKRLKSASEESQRAGITDLGLYLRLALGEIEATQGNRQAGRELLKAVEREARKNGMGLIAGKAATALAKTV